MVTVRDIAAALGAEFAGDGSLVVQAAAEPAAAGPRDLALAMDARYAAGLRQGQAAAALIWPGADWESFGLKAAIFAPRGRLAMAGLSRIFDPGPLLPAGISPMAVIDGLARIGEGAAIGPFVVIGPGVQIGPRARIASHASIAEGARIGADLLLFQGARIGHRVVIGDRFIGHQNSVVGADGFAFVTTEKSGVEEVRQTLEQRREIRDQSWHRIHSLGSVRLGDDVELGANSCIDRGTVRDTEVGSGTKIDNLVQVGHNVRIGRDCLMCGQSGAAGSARIGDRVVIGGASAINDNIFVGDDVIIGGGSGVFTNVPKGRVILGYPAVKVETHVEIQKALRRLPRLARRVAELEARLGVTASSSGAGKAAEDD
jgi:UDP-3-O-[3-hydroxymyristoyl] glucosamine N-acyltransferase